MFVEKCDDEYLNQSLSKTHDTGIVEKIDIYGLQYVK